MDVLWTRGGVKSGVGQALICADGVFESRICKRLFHLIYVRKHEPLIQDLHNIKANGNSMLLVKMQNGQYFNEVEYFVYHMYNRQAGGE